MWTDFLTLLARDAPAVEYEAPVLAARAEHLDAGTIAALEEGKRLALQVRDNLLTRARREEELSALFDTAYDLARLSDVDSVLTAIVHRARQLLHTDIAYLSMNDPEQGDTYMRVTDGSTSARFQQVRLGMGEGLGGLVAQTAMPYWTASYFEDERFNHTGDIDGAVVEEGLVAILGVPLRLGSTVIGVLYAANRTSRPFTRAEVSLLDSLAAHAAAAIDKARLLDETRAALTELRSVNLLLQERTESVLRASAAHDRMAQVVLRGGGVEEVSGALAEVVGGSVLVLDDEGRRLCSVGELQPPAAEELAQAVDQSVSTGRAASCRLPALPTYAVAVVVGHQRFGAILLQRERPLDDTDQRILERAGLVTALLMLSLRSGVEAENRVRGELLDSLIRDPGQDPSALLERARRLGADLTVPHVVLAVDLGEADRTRAVSAVDHLAARTGGLSGIFDGRPVLMLPGDEPTALAGTLAQELGSTLAHRVTVGAAGPVTGIPGVAEAHGEAVRCVRALRTLGRTGEGSSLTDLGFVGLVLGDEPDVHGFVATALGPLLDYDERRGTDLVGTLRAYFESGGNLTRTKDALHVHVNTVSQRLDRIATLIGEDWQLPERQLELQVALRLHRVAGARSHLG